MFDEFVSFGGSGLQKQILHEILHPGVLLAPQGIHDDDDEDYENDFYDGSCDGRWRELEMHMDYRPERDIDVERLFGLSGFSSSSVRPFWTVICAGSSFFDSLGAGFDENARNFDSEAVFGRESSKSLHIHFLLNPMAREVSSHDSGCMSAFGTRNCGSCKSFHASGRAIHESVVRRLIDLSRTAYGPTLKVFIQILHPN